MLKVGAGAQLLATAEVRVSRRLQKKDFCRLFAEQPEMSVDDLQETLPLGRDEKMVAGHLDKFELAASELTPIHHAFNRGLRVFTATNGGQRHVQAKVCRRL